MENKINQRAAEMKAAMEREISDEVKAAFKKRNDLNRKLIDFDEKAICYADQIKAVLSEIDVLKNNISEILSEVGDPEVVSREVREKAIEVEDLTGWINQIEKKFMPEVKKDLEQLEKIISQTVHRDILAKLLKQYNEELSEKVKNYIEVDIVAWRKAFGEFLKETKTNANQYLTLTIKNPNIERYIR